MAPSPKLLEPPKSGLWRVGRSPDPHRFSQPLDPGLLESRAAGNRFDISLDEQERRPVARNDEALARIADLYGLTVF